jgi:hypothetical protein
MKARVSAMDALAWAATGLLLLVVVWRIALMAFAPDPVRAHEVLVAAGSQAAAGRLLVIMDASDTLGVRSTAAAEHQRRPGLSLELRTLNDAQRQPDSGVRALLESYGHAELPVILTLDSAGHVLRVAPLR